MPHPLSLILAVLLFFASSVDAQGGKASSGQPAEIDARAAFQPCTACHGRADPELDSGKLWIGRVAETSCVLPMGPKSAPMRKALREYLLGSQDKVAREEKVRDAGAEDGRLVLANSDTISILLVPEDKGTPVRVVWKAKQGTEARTLPVGKYMVRHYAITRRDGKGVEWQLWGSGNKGRKITVTSGEPTRVDFNPRVHLATNAMWTPLGLQVGITPTGDSRMGITIMRAGKRIPAEYRVLGENGITAKGTMAYG